MDNKMDIIGQPVTRQDAKLKVTGTAKYSAEFALPGMVYAVLVGAPIARGHITSIDTAAARAAPGVLEIMTFQNRPKMNSIDEKTLLAVGTFAGEATLPLQDGAIVYADQAVAVVIADTYERARYAAKLVKIEAEKLEPVAGIADAQKLLQRGGTVHDAGITEPDKLYGVIPAQSKRGAPAAEFARAARKVEAKYYTPTENHNPIEPHAIIAAWKNDELTVYASKQGTVGSQTVFALVFGVAPERVRVINHFTGGAFGCKGPAGWPHELLAVAAAKMVNRPVKLVLMRQQMFAGVGHRGECEMTLKIGTDERGAIRSLSQETLTSGHPHQPLFFESAGLTSELLYDAPSHQMTHRVAQTNNTPPIYMRAPGESPGLWALESAIDEMAHEAGLDPLAFRLLNHADKHPGDGLPWSSKHLKECYERGAKMIGWGKRALAPRQTREGRYLIGYGMASATYPGNRSPAAAKCRLYPDGRAVAACSGVDVGTGAYTVFRQVAADTLGLPLHRVVFELGDSKLPYAPLAGGSQLSASVAPAIVEACQMAQRAAAEMAIQDKRSPLHGRKLEEITFRDGLAVLASDTSKGEAVSGIVGRSGQPYLEVCARHEIMSSAAGAEGLNQKRRSPCAVVMPNSKEDFDQQKYAFQSFGAHFCRLRVDEELGVVRLLNWAAVMDVGRILNHRTARSQILGGIGFGIGMALCEETLYDPNSARPIVRNLADYHIASNADVPPIQVEFLDIPDPHISTVGCRGVGEIGITGVAGAIGNAIFNATGKRLRELPLTPDKVMGA